VSEYTTKRTADHAADHTAEHATHYAPVCATLVAAKRAACSDSNRAAKRTTVTHTESAAYKKAYHPTECSASFEAQHTANHEPDTRSVDATRLETFSPALRTTSARSHLPTDNRAVYPAESASITAPHGTADR